MVRKVVLLVETEQQEGLSARKIILENLNCEVLTARNAAEALDILDRVQPDIALVHGIIEGQSCEEIISIIQQRCPGIRMVALVPGAAGLCGPVVTLDSMRPQDLVRFFESSADPQPA